MSDDLTAETVDPVTHEILDYPVGDEIRERRKKTTVRDVLREAAAVKDLRLTRYGLLPLVIVVLVDFAQTFDNAILGVLGPDIRRDFGVSVAAIGWVGSLVGLVMIVISPAIGYFADRWRRVPMVGISTIFSGIFATLSGRAQTLTQLGVIRTFDLGGERVGDVPMTSLVPDFYPVDARGKMFAFKSMAQRVATLIAPVSVGALAVRYGWRVPFYAAGPLLVIVGILVLVFLREPVRGYWERKRMGADEDIALDEEAPVGFGEAFRTILANRTLRRILLATIVASVGGAWFGFLFPFYLAERFGLNAFQRSLLHVPAGIVEVGAIFVGGGLVDLLVRRRPSRVLVTLGAIGLFAALAQLVVVVTPSVWVLVVVNVVVGATGALFIPAGLTISTLVLPPRLRGQGVGIIAFIGLVPLFARPLAGSLQASFGTQGALAVAVPFLLVAAILQMTAAAFFESDMRAAVAASMATEEHRRAKAEGRTKLLVCRDVDVHYGTVQVLFGVDFDVEDGDVVALLGTNGAGKSTLLRAISGIQEASNGAIVFDGRDITHVPPYEIARLGIAHMPGGRGVFPGLTVEDNLDLALAAGPTTDRPDRLEQALAYFPVLRERMATTAGSLSGGEQQMVALAQAFLARPRLLIIDELSLGLSPAVVAQLLEIVEAIHQQGTTIILVEQSVNVALQAAKRAVFMEKGEVRFEGPTADLLARPDLVRSVYVKGATAMSASPARRATSGGGRALLEIDHVSKRYGGKIAVDDLSLVLHEGEALGIIGPNGAGKTTLFDVVSGFQLPDGGRIVLDGVDITEMSPDGRARAKLVRRFQDARLFPALTVFETICIALERTLDVRNTFVIATRLPAVRRSEARVRRAAERLVEVLELGAFRDKFVADLSTGLRRVVDLACVLAAEPRVLLLDEPSSGIAQAEAEGLGPLLRRVRHDTGCSMLVIEHDMNLITAISDELVAMVQGAVVVQGPADEVMRHPVVVEAYLGEREETINRQRRR